MTSACCIFTCICIPRTRSSRQVEDHAAILILPDDLLLLPRHMSFNPKGTSIYGPEKKSFEPPPGQLDSRHSFSHLLDHHFLLICACPNTPRHGSFEPPPGNSGCVTILRFPDHHQLQQLHKKILLQGHGSFEPPPGRLGSRNHFNIRDDLLLYI